MFTPIKIQYLSEASRVGGRYGTVEQEVEIDCLWDGNTSKKNYGQRLQNVGVDVEVTILFEDGIPIPNPDFTRIVKDDETYEVVGDDTPPADLGLEGTYTLQLKRIKKAS